MATVAGLMRQRCRLKSSRIQAQLHSLKCTNTHMHAAHTNTCAQSRHRHTPKCKQRIKPRAAELQSCREELFPRLALCLNKSPTAASRKILTLGLVACCTRDCKARGNFQAKCNTDASLLFYFTFFFLMQVQVEASAKTANCQENNPTPLWPRFKKKKKQNPNQNSQRRVCVSAPSCSRGGALGSGHG